MGLLVAWILFLGTHRGICGPGLDPAAQAGPRIVETNINTGVVTVHNRPWTCQNGVLADYPIFTVPPVPAPVQSPNPNRQ